MIGSTFGRYRILEKIGQGGMGEVFLAEDGTLHRKVALKFLPEALAASPESRERFLVEARAAAALSHPNICVIHEVDEVGDRPFIAMEYVEGETLQDAIRSGSMAPDSAAEIARQLAAGLEEAHGKGIIHRDIKSSNIMVTPRGQAKIMDFGLAKVQGGPALTKSQTTLGTVSYMSPEQAGGDAVDHRTDLWSAGVVLYELLTGALPFPAGREAAVVHRILYDRPTPLPEHEAEVPRELRRVVERCLEKDPEDRYPSAAELGADLRAYQEGVRADAAGFNLRSLRRSLRRPKVVAPVAIAVLAVTVLSVGVARRQAEVGWARTEAIPEIRRLIEQNDVWRNLVAPYRLAERAEAVLGDDPELAELMAQVSREIEIRTDPPGAVVSMKEYVKPDTAWTRLGTTPLAQARVPIGIFRWKFEKEGYETVEAAASTWDVGGEDMIGGNDLFRRLDPADSLPPGMVRVPSTETTTGVLPGFFIGRYEVSNREYKEFVDAGGYRNRDYWQHPVITRDGRELAWEEAMGEFVDRSGQPGPSTWLGGAYPAGQGDHPVTGVSWYEAAAYAAYRGSSLPTADHWDVARGGYTPMLRFRQLGGYAVLAPFANFGRDAAVPVGSLPGITAYGAYDMAGNVREWCWNRAEQGRIVRGGAWEDNMYAFGGARQAPAINRSARNGIRLALYPERDAVPEAAFGPREIVGSFDPLAEPPVPDAVFRVYKERFSYDETDLDARVESREKSQGEWVHERVSFDAAYDGERVLAHLFLPENVSPPFQTVVYFPGSASTWLPSSEDIESYYEFTMFLSYLVRSGRAVLYPVYQGTFERGGPEYMQLHVGTDSHAYAEYLTRIVQDVRRSVDYLETREDIDSERLAYYGMSWGGRLGAIVPAVEERFEASVLVAGGLQHRPPFPRPEARDLTYVRRVKTPTLILNGRYDGVFPPDRSARPLLELLGTPPEHKKLILYETDHIPPRTEYIKETLAWLDRYLGPARR